MNEIQPRERQYTKQMAALDQIHSALGLFEAGRYAECITLALAAEECLPRNGEYLVVDTCKEAIRNDQGEDEAKNFGITLNNNRNWLKHYNADNTETITICFEEAEGSIIRSITRYYSNYGLCAGTELMKSFMQRIVDNYRN